MISERHEFFPDAADRLAAAGVEDPAGDAGRLLDFALGLFCTSEEAGGGNRSEEESLEWFWSAIVEREERRPVSQIIGRRMFFGRNFRVNASVMDPRPESETLVLQALDRDPSRILDIGTGSGCLLLSILAKVPDATGLGVDISDEALEVARDNANDLGLSDRVRFVRSDWLSGVTGEYDLVVANPPYVSEEEYARLAPEVRIWEPRGAITLGGDGLRGYREIAKGVGKHVAAGGELLVEIGPKQRSRVTAIFCAEGFVESGTAHDLDARERALAFRHGQGKG